jgi:hypothetical protein
MTKNYSNLLLNLQTSSKTKLNLKKEINLFIESGFVPCFMFLTLTSFASGLFINDLYDVKSTSSSKTFEVSAPNERYASELIKIKNNKKVFLVDDKKALVTVK